jgi:hypothetical protein
MWEILALGLWTFFVAYTTWYFTKAKYTVPISVNEARILWKIHRRDLRCNGRKWREIKSDEKLVGFECECGYRHVQRRPVVASLPTAIEEQQVEMKSKLDNARKPLQLQRK